MYLSEYILNNVPNDWEIYWVLYKDVDRKRIDRRINVVSPYSLKYIYALYSSEFVFSNSRTNKYGDLFVKKTGQKYVMTWHGSTPLKKIEKDAGKALPPLYQKCAKRDSKMCDLMLSNCNYFTDIIKRAFWYDGPILVKGLPRNDIYFDINKKNRIHNTIIKDYNIPTNAKIILYAPTFRNEKDCSPFKLNWNSIIDAFESLYKCPITILLRLHPNSLGVVDIKELLLDHRVIDMCYYKDMQELLCISDVLITDYSSTMFEIGLQGKVCMLYAPDIKKYDRGFYFKLRDLPFPLATDEYELENIVKNFDFPEYQNVLSEFNNRYLQSVDTGNACKELVQWMSSESNK